MGVQTMITAEELICLPDDGYRTELVRGELVREPPPGYEHGRIALEIGAEFREFVKAHQLGASVNVETGFILQRDPDTVRLPDVSVIRAERAAALAGTLGFVSNAPDLAVEVLSTSDRLPAVRKKVAELIAAGSKVVVIIDPVRYVVYVHRANGLIETLSPTDTLVVEEVLPGFAMPLAELFAKS